MSEQVTAKTMLCTGMSTKTPPVTADSFEKVVAALATKWTQSRRLRSGKTAKDMADWREIASEAFRTNKLGDTLRRAIEALSVQYREVLFLHDVKNLDTADTAWVLNITVGAARYRLLRARMHVRDALASLFLSKPGEKKSDHGNSCTHEIPHHLAIATLQHSLSLT
jgi:hypothetical protein